MNTEMSAVLSQLARSDPKNIHLYRFIGGVLYALGEYDHLATMETKQAQSDQFYSDELQSLLKDSDSPPLNWLRGFFYNAAVLRLDAAWERSLRVLLDGTTKGDLRELYNKLRNKEQFLHLPEYDKAPCKLVREEVNDLKHQVAGPSEDMRERPEVVKDGLKQLLDLLQVSAR